MIFDLFDDNTSSSVESSPDFCGPSEAELAAQREKFAKFYRNLMSGNLEDNAGPYKLRCIVESNCWWVPTKEDGSFELLNVKKGELRRLIAGIAKDGRRTHREGQGGQFVQVYCQKPGLRAKHFDGRQLARNLPSGVTGLVIKGVKSLADDDEPVELSAEFFEELRSLAKSIEVEDALLAPGPLNAAILRKAKFRVATYNGYLCTNFLMIGANSPTAATHEDTFFTSDDEVVIKMMSGKELFGKVLNDLEFDGLNINPVLFGRNGQKIKDMLLSPSFLYRALEEEACHLRAKELVVRSREEFDLWLELTGFPTEREVEEQTTDNGRKTIRARSKKPCSDWRLQDTDISQVSDEIAQTPVFTILSTSSDQGFGEGASQVLCPGLLARRLYNYPPKKKKESQHNWKPGTSLLIGRLLSSEDIQEARRRTKFAYELLKLIPSGSDRIPRWAVLTVSGAAFVRERPFVVTREWIGATLALSKKYCSSWVWGSP